MSLKKSNIPGKRAKRGSKVNFLKLSKPDNQQTLPDI